MTEESRTKIDKKKLKKLRNRVARLQTEGEKSGLLISKEFDEYQRLDPSTASSLGPSISIRKRKEGIKVEGAHHRDLLAWLLKQILFPGSPDNSSIKSKKRSRNDDARDSIRSASIPSWASIHNSGALKSIVVLEVQALDELISCTEVLDSFLKSSNSKSHVKIPTKWFQGPEPRSISDSLLYWIDNKSKRSKVNSQSTSKQELLRKLQDLTLSPANWNKEGYPIFIETHNKSKKSRGCRDSALHLDLNSASLEDAIALVNEIGGRIENQNEEDEQLYVSTIDKTESEEDWPVRVFGMDCEMVRTSIGSELARITLIQFHEFDQDILETKTVLDALVKPDNTIIDYLEKHSGMTAKLLDPVKTRLPLVQAALRRFLRPNDILIGHSLENDLHATHYIHPNVIDTALVFRKSHGRSKFSLRHLSAFLLRKKIQSGSHCSEEDASAALELAIRRAWIGDSFYVPSGDERRSLLNGLNTDARVMCVGPADWLQAHITNTSNGIHALGYQHIKECEKAVLAWIKSPRKAQLVCSQLVVEKGASTSLGELLSSIVQELPSTSLLLVALQQDYQSAKKRLNQKRASQNPRATFGWSMEKEGDLQQIVERARSGLVYWVGKSNELQSYDRQTK